jgi:hypothetical protein
LLKRKALPDGIHRTAASFSDIQAGKKGNVNLGGSGKITS